MLWCIIWTIDLCNDLNSVKRYLRNFCVLRKRSSNINCPLPCLARLHELCIWPDLLVEILPRHTLNPCPFPTNQNWTWLWCTVWALRAFFYPGLFQCRHRRGSCGPVGHLSIDITVLMQEQNSKYSFFSSSACRHEYKPRETLCVLGRLVVIHYVALRLLN